MRNNRGNVVVGGLFILFGLLYLGSIFNFWPFISFWSLGVLIGLAVLSVICLSSKNFIGGFFFLGMFLSKGIDYLPAPYDDMYNLSFWNIMVLSVIFGIGVEILYKGGTRKSKKKYRSTDDYYYSSQNADDVNVIIDVDVNEDETYTYEEHTSQTQNDDMNSIFVDSNFKEITRYVTTQNFKGGEINTSFGQVTIHLTQAMLAKDGAHMALYCSFGQIKIYIPRSWAVNNKVSATMFADISDDRAEIIDNSIPNLTLTGNVNFGNIKILYV